ncbi:MAG TPA: DUF2911 domain-containing protein [Cyclobacteriaceae bacterium]|nr:DUF2911 domain-containing protein [Cyclobacteriaceae bacterium]
MKTPLILLLAAACFVAEAQVVTPAASPSATVSTVVGLTDIKVEYFRPQMRGRKIFGDGAEYLTPYGRLWRTGANGGTAITFSDDVTVEGIKVPKGKYLILTIPGASEWTVSLYSDVSLGGNLQAYDKSKEVANFKVKPVTLPQPVETFTVNIGDISNDSKQAKVEIAWEKTSVKFTVGVEYDSKVMASIESTKDMNPFDLFQAAVYYLENGKDLKQAMTWITKAEESIKDAYWLQYQKARIQQGLGDKKGALATAKASLENAKAADDLSFQKMNQALIAALQ